ncbi:CDP-diacylglycerol--glycerol-3-phosphate 3-phosphatidyltransferase [Amycolatopsis carbonis]|uniref:CDP-diacylglycerol--glycerol-3-phosphate 3-phosphatidyltransferase n=1 Tax=Amycolatopsis carbonis TaxID=715471 RepID=A0A9Y2MRG7_9PSEU|nr:CDP-diacylglycerol--glycerol-3-phosphate 3-phosphatidyltransferase [Amycolatopsis sp. 2-15]WIX74903.1 CDP-diacylglycerol--glycerol-3-phosphate 3-phosphatidyltransferase [Amycolatopsis sp. 2-15]
MSAAPSDAGEGMTRAAEVSSQGAAPQPHEVPAETGAARMPEPAVPEPTPVPTLNVANLLTLSRLVLVPLFVLALFAGDGVDTTWRAIATGLFVIASATDQVDGWVARKYGLITDFGKIADPIADKALIGAALVGLSVLGELPWWVTIVIAVREIGVTLLRFWVIRHGVIPASRGGKAKTMTQILAIVVYLLPLPAGAEPVRWVLMGLAVLLTVVTGVDYLIRAIRLRAAGRRATGA